jgi:hypothetical protein
MEITDFLLKIEDFSGIRTNGLISDRPLREILYLFRYSKFMIIFALYFYLIQLQNKSYRGINMKIQVLAEDGEVLDTIEDVHLNLKSQYGMGVLLEKLIEVYKHKYSTYMYEKYKVDRRSGDDRRRHDD